MKDLGELLLRLMERKDFVPSSTGELMRKLRLQPQRQGELQSVLETLERTGRIARIKGDRYIIPYEADLIPGRIRMNRQGTGFLQPDDAGLEEIRIPEGATGTALHEDRVLVRREIDPRERGRLRGKAAGAARQTTGATGRVVRVLERHRQQLVGTLQRGRKFLFVIPDDPRISHDVYVPEPKDVGRPARVGDKVVVELAEWESRHVSPEGEVIEVLGAPDEEGVDMLSVLRNYDLPLHFPREVLDQARSIGTTVSDADLKGRTDCRGHQVITIDPDDAKDFDDAICLQRSGSNWRLWVHIADVSHYIRPGTPLDVEARKRGNSTYLVDRVIPMLPEALSNELCSLKPDVDRLTKCVEFLLSHEGAVLETKFYPAVIRSKRRFSYQEAFAILQGKPGNSIETMLHEANAIAQRVRRARFRSGSLNLDFPEMKIRLDEQGRISRIEKVVNDISHQLIEECMLLANEAVATRLMQMNRPAIYRVHEEPDEKRLNEYREEILSHDIPCGNLKNRQEIQRLLHRLDSMTIGQALKIGFLKSLMRARYAAEPLGHYGLAKKKYTHFTSPIRRYADLLVHRVLFAGHKEPVSVVRQAADHISETERNSDDAERDSKDVKLYAFLKKQIASGSPTVYDALVTDLRNFGFFVDVPGLAMSGAVRLSSLEDDFYIYEPERNHLIGRRTRKVIRLGDRLSVQVANVDSYKKQVDFKLARTPKAPAKEPARHARKAAGGRTTTRKAGQRPGAPQARHGGIS
jgi:ribonuclease R